MPNETHRASARYKNSPFFSSLLGDYFAMWANTLPEGGLLVVGMENDGSFSGCHKLSQNQLNEIEKCHQTFCPDARVESKRVPVAASDGNESFVIVFRVR